MPPPIHAPSGTRVYEAAPAVVDAHPQTEPSAADPEPPSRETAALALARLQTVGAERQSRRWRIIASIAIAGLSVAIPVLAVLVFGAPSQVPAPPVKTATVTELPPTETVVETSLITETATATATETATATSTERVTDVRTEVTRELQTVTVTATVTAPAPIN